MSPVKPPAPPELVGQDAFFASLPETPTPRGGSEFGFRGETGGAAPDETAESDPFAGAGPLLEESPAQVYKTLDGLVLRQELIALNHLAQDTHWTYVKLGFPWSTLTKEPNRDVYKQSLPYGSSGITIQAVPNKVWDLVNKTTESLLVDFPEAEAEPDDDSEEAQGACQMANRFLAEDASEQGTNDAVLFNDRVARALTCASTYLECWTDPTGGGYVPLQIKAHPQAESVESPLVGPDGMPTTDYVLRYVTTDQQFTDDPSQAAPQWQPKLRASKWQREHIRVYPESCTIDQAEKVIILGYCTIGEAKRRWPTVAAMSPQALSTLTDWTPPRYLVLLPPFQRARWKLTDGRDKEKAGASDERILFYYHAYVKACPDYPKGADVVASGANGGTILDKALLSQPVEVTRGQGTTTEIRCMEIPIVQLTPRADMDEQDPTGRAFVEMFAGAAEHNAFLAMSFTQILDQILHTPFAVPATSPIEGWQVEEARASGDMLVMNGPSDKPTQLNPPVLPGQFFNMYELSDDSINSIASQNRPAQGSDRQQEVSGKARQIAINQNNVALSGMQTAVNTAYARWCRIKIERCMADFSTAQQIGYVGEDGAYQQDEWTGVDFALVGKVTIKAGTGTMMPPDQKVQYLGNLKDAQMLTAEDAAEAARPSYAQRLGLPPDAQQQRVERQVGAWLKGPPGPEWVAQAQQYAQAQAVAQQQDAAQQQAWQQNAQAQQMAGQPPAPQPAPSQPVDQMGQPMPAPWSPFAPLPMDDEPMIASMRQRRLSKLMAQSDFSAQPPEWRALVEQEYARMRNAVAAAQPQPALPKGVTVGVSADPSNVAAAEQAATHPSQPQSQPQSRAA